MLRSLRNLLCGATAAGISAAAWAAPSTTFISYQGRLLEGGGPANGNYDMEFSLFAAALGGGSLATLCVENVLVVDGLFTVNINFGTAFETGTANFLNIRVRADNIAGNCGVGVYTPLTPRQPILATPYALCALKPDGHSLDASDGSPEDALFVDAIGEVGIFTAAPEARLHVIGTSDSEPVGGGVVVIGGTTTANISIDQNEIMARNNGLVAELFLNNDGGNVNCGANVLAAAFLDLNNTAFSLDPANTGVSATLAGSIDLAVGEGIQIGSGLITATNAWTIGGANVLLRLGDSTADQVSVPAKDFFMSDTATIADGDQNIYFTDTAITTSNVLRWDDSFVLACGDNIGQIDSRFEWHIEDNANAAWMLTSGSDDDAELTFDELGNMNIDGTLTSSNGCDLAEAFLGPQLAPGTVVVLDASRPEAVIASNGAYQSGIVGVVSTVPSVLMRGATADVYPLYPQIQAAREAARVTDGERALLEEMAELEVAAEGDQALLSARRIEIQGELAAYAADRQPAEELVNELERQIDGALRGDVPVALVGRVPVRVVGPVRAGQHLTTSDVAGVAMAMTKPGPTLGIALADFDGAGEGAVIALIQPGWHGAAATDAGEMDVLRNENSKLRARLDALESKLDALLRRE